MNKKTVAGLRKEYPDFYYESFDFSIDENRLSASFVFKAGNECFNPRVVIECEKAIKVPKADMQALSYAVFNLGMVESFSYWKAFCSPNIVVRAGYLDRGQMKWWEDLLLNGMGQYFFENKIDFTGPGFVKISCTAENVGQKLLSLEKAKGALLPIGGGKDSATSIEICRKIGLKITPFCLNPNKDMKALIKAGGLTDGVNCKRKIEERLLELNREGYPNGHTPFVAYLSFLGLLSCYLSGNKYFILSNEMSSNEANTVYKGREINHQYSKTFDFEKKFRDYTSKYLVSGFEYMSLLRPLYELQIARIFSRYSQYHKVFLSCNEAYKTCSGQKEKTGKWCASCSKCLFVFIMMSPFLSKKNLTGIFGKDMFEDESMIQTMLELVDEKKVKPLECVGTRKESLIGLYLSWKNNDILGMKQPVLLDHFARKILPKYEGLDKEVDKVLNNWNKKSFIPEEWKKYYI